MFPRPKARIDHLLIPVFSLSNSILCRIMLPQFEIDQAFDLDEALTMPEESASEFDEQHELGAKTKSAADILLVEIPTPMTDSCVVCMRGFRVGGAGGRQVRCGHVFHVDCIAQWVSVNSSCPLCRARLSSDQ